MLVLFRACTSQAWRTLLAGGVALLLARPASGASDDALTAPLVDPGLAALLQEELSGELAKESVIAIARHHRIQGSRGYRDAAHWVLEQLRSMGFDEEHAWIESFPSDGTQRYQTWQSPSGWDIERGELRMVAPREERLVGYPEIAMSVMTYSNAGHAQAPLVWVGRGTSDADFEDRDVEGKIVLATGHGGDVHRQAVIRRGALAVVCYLDDERAPDHPDMIAYTGLWPRTEELPDVTFGFNISNRQGETLRELLEAGEEVVLDARVEGIGLEPYFMDVVVAHIPGREHPDDQLVFSAHLDHPKESANDNASGSAAILDIARGLRTLIDQGRMQAPARSLTFLWVPEFFGTMAYIDAHPELKGPALGGRVLANMNMDMVGENTGLLHCRLELTRTPGSLPSVVDDVVANVAAMVDGMDIRTPRGSQSAFNYRVTPYSPGSDHMMFIDRKIPATMFWHTPDYTHHTSEDTSDKVDPAQLERCELIAACTMLHLANLNTAQGIELCQVATASASERMGHQARRAYKLVMNAPDGDVTAAWSLAQEILDQASREAYDTLRSVMAFRDDEGVLAVLRQCASNLSDQWTSHSNGLKTLASMRGQAGNRPPPVDALPDERVPLRLTRGPLAFDLPESRLPAERAAWYASEGAAFDRLLRFETLNFVDGKHNVSQIAMRLRGSLGAVSTAEVGRFLDDLVTAGALAWR